MTLDAREGYKKTDVGTIPAAWEVCRLNSVSESIMDL